MEHSLRELTPHGTAYQPFQVLHFPMPEQMQFRVMGHWHEEIEILYLRRGAYRLERNMQEERLSEGTVCIIGSEELHQLEALERGSLHSVILFHPRILSFEMMDEGQARFIHPLLTGQRRFPGQLTAQCGCYDEICRLLADMYTLWDKKGSGWYLRCKADLLQLVALLAEEKLLSPGGKVPPEEGKIMQMKHLASFLEEHYAEKITLAELAAEMGRNSQYLCRCFRETMGATIMEYLNRYRIEQAARMLSGTDKKILEISLECGYDNFSYFIRKFRQYKSVTPTDWRKMVKQHNI